MGTIVDQNSDASAEDNWALVTGTMVVNTIVGDLSDITSIQGSYDYLVDYTIGGQDASIGDTYDPVGDTFTSPPPPPPDWISIVQSDFDNIAESLLACLTDAGSNGGNLSPTDLATAYSNSLSDEESKFTTNQLTLMNSIYSYILG